MQLCILDVPAAAVLGFVAAILYAKRLKASNPDWWLFLMVIVTAVFWLNALLAAVGLMEPWFGLLPSVETGGWAAVFTALSYPLWYSFGGQLAMTIFGHDRTEAGIVWPFSIKETTDPFVPSWKSQVDEKRP